MQEDSFQEDERDHDFDEKDEEMEKETPAMTKKPLPLKRGKCGDRNGKGETSAKKLKTDTLQAELLKEAITVLKTPSPKETNDDEDIFGTLAASELALYFRHKNQADGKNTYLNNMLFEARFGMQATSGGPHIWHAGNFSWSI